MGASEVEAFITSLAVDRNVAASTQSQAFSALMFLYQELLQNLIVISILFVVSVFLILALNIADKKVPQIVHTMYFQR